MKKMISSLLILAMCAGIVSGCGKELMEVPEYPLEKSVIEEKLAAQKLNWTAEEETADTDGESVYTLRDEDGTRVAVLVSAADGEDRMLKVSFLSSLREEDADGRVIKNKEWGGLMGATAAMYGGFKNASEPYKEFTDGALDKKNKTVHTYERDEMTDEEDKIYEDIVVWKDEVQGITCIYKIGQPEDLDGGLDKPKQELISLTYYTGETYAEE